MRLPGQQSRHIFFSFLSCRHLSTSTTLPFPLQATEHYTPENKTSSSLSIEQITRKFSQHETNKMDAQQPLADRTNTHTTVSHEKIDDMKSTPANLNSLEYHRQILQGCLLDQPSSLPALDRRKRGQFVLWPGRGQSWCLGYRFSRKPPRMRQWLS